MYNATEQFAERNKANVAQAARLAALALQNAEKLARLNLQTVKSTLAQGVENAQAVAAIKDVRQLVTLNAALAEANAQAVLGYSKNLYGIATEVQAQFTALVEESQATYTRGAAAWIDQAAKSAPAGSEAVVSAFRQGLAASTAAFARFNKASNEVVSLADASIRAAAANASKVAATTKGRKAA